MNTRDRGQVGELSKEIGPFQVTWRIDNCLSLTAEGSPFYSSPHFYFLDMQWNLTMYPNGRPAFYGPKGWIGLFLKRCDQGPTKFVRYMLCMRKADDTEKIIFSTGSYRKISEKSPEWGISKFLQRTELAPSDALTVVCKLWSGGKDSTEDDRIVSDGIQREDHAREDLAHLDMKGGAILRAHLQDMLLDGKDHDVTLKVKDQEFKAHKCMLRARSPVFAAMFAHNMTENECGDVCIEDCDPSAFGEFLKYVYGGKMENMSPSTATGLYYAADKYDVPDLKETCVEFLKASLTMHVIPDVITLAMKHGENELLEYTMEYFSKHFLETLKTVEWQRFNARNPNLVNEINIKAMEISRKNTE